MTVRNYLTVTAIVGLIFGVAFLVAAGPLVGMYNVQLNDGGVFVGRLFGVALIGLGLIAWFGRDLRDTQAVRAIILTELVANGLGFLVALWGQLTGVGGVNALGWSTVLIYLLLAAGAAYFQFMRPDLMRA
jgi:hypothetical protein